MHPKPRRSFTQRGFTLVELLVVIAIVTVLVAILIPVLGAVRSRAHRVECAGNLRSIIMGAEVFAMDHKNKFPYIDDPASGIYSGGVPNPSNSGLVDQLFSYVGSIKAFYCTGVPEVSSYSFTSQTARTSSRYRQMGYYYFVSPTTKAFGAAMPTTQLWPGEPNRVMMTCIYNVGSSGHPHDYKMNVAFADGHVGQLGQGKSITTATVNYSTMLLK